MFSFDLSFDGERALFCMKPEDEKAYHLYEIGLDGKGFRQITSGGKPFGAAGPDTAWGGWGERFLPGKTPTPTTDVSWGDSAIFSGPATSLTGPLGVKQEHGTVAIHADGSVCFRAPPCRMLYFQVLDEHYRAVHTMRSWVSVRPGERRGCVGCHELHNATYGGQPVRTAMVPDALEPPPWGVRSLSYVKDIQPIFDRACAECHSGDGKAVESLDLTLRPDPQGQRRWGGIFPEPYLTLLMGKDHARVGGACPGFDGSDGYVAVPNTITTRYDTLPPLACLSPKSRLIDRARDHRRCLAIRRTPGNERAGGSYFPAAPKENASPTSSFRWPSCFSKARRPLQVVGRQGRNKAYFFFQADIIS